MKKTIYIGDSDNKFLFDILRYFEEEDYEVEAFTDGELLLSRFLDASCDFLIMEENLPSLSGSDISKIIRDFSSVPIIVTSFQGTAFDKVRCLTLGCDDYIVKPVSPIELLAKTKSILRRIEFAKSTYCEDFNVLSMRSLVLDLSNHKAMLMGSNLNLTNKEFEVLKYLISNKHRAIPRDELLRYVWNFTRDLVDTRAIDDCVKRLRKKLVNFDAPIQIETVRGFGFKVIAID